MLVAPDYSIPWIASYETGNIPPLDTQMYFVYKGPNDENHSAGWIHHRDKSGGAVNLFGAKLLYDIGGSLS